MSLNAHFATYGGEYRQQYEGIIIYIPHSQKTRKIDKYVLFRTNKY